MAGGLALPPASAATQDNAPQEEFQWNPTQEEIDAYLNVDLNDLFPTGAENGNAADEYQFPANLTADDAFGHGSQDVTLMQPQFPMPATMPMQTPRTPMPPPDMSLGPSYDPRIGWYYPAPTPANIPPPPMPYTMPQEGYTPASSTVPSAMASRMATPTPGMAAPGRTRDRKRKYGPAAYLDEQAKNTSAVHPRAVSISQAEYTSQAKRRDDRTNGTSDTKFARKRTAPSIVQVCVCSDKEQKKVKRPKNAFILYRMNHAAQIMRSAGNRNNQNVSTQAARMWKNESPAVKKRFHGLAEQEAQRHKELYPDYVYQPGLTNRHKFGSASCKCGAYQANIAAMRAAKEAAGLRDTDNDSEPEELDEYLPPPGCVPAQQSRAPTAPMTYPPLPDPSTFGFATETQQMQAQEYVNEMKRKRDFSSAYSELNSEPPIAKRLRRRTGVSYNEPNEMDFDDTDFLTYPDPPQKAKRRPSPIISGPPDMFTLQQDTTQLFKNNSPPALNTRARSRSRTSIDQGGGGGGNGGFGLDLGFNTDFGFNQDLDFTEEFDFDALMNNDLFGDVGQENNPADDTIIVATHSRRSSSRKSSATKSRPGSRGSLGGSKSSPTLRRSPRHIPRVSGGRVSKRSA